MPLPIFMKILLWSAYLTSLYFAIFWFLVLFDKEKKPKTRELRKHPAVSIVVPAYNEGKNIISTLASLVQLDYPKNKLEIIVVNDGSRDSTGSIVKGFIAKNKAFDMSVNRKASDMSEREHLTSSRMSHDHARKSKIFDIKLIDKKNEGKGAALNDGLRIAKGEFFVCLDADSVAAKDSLKKILPHFTSRNIAVVLPLLKVNKPKNLWQKMQWLEYIVNMFYKKLMSRLDCVHVSPGPFSVYRKEVLDKIGGFDEDNLTEDLEITLRIQSKNYRIVQLLDAEIFTVAPKTFRELYRQRNRWFKGAVLNALKYRYMMFNRKYGDFGIIQMPVIIISGMLAVILFTSAVYYGLKPYAKAFYNSIFIDFDFYTLIRTFKADFNLLDLNYTTLLIFIVMVSISVYVLRKSHAVTKEKVNKHGFLSLLAYLLFYFLVLGFIWVGIIIDLAFRKKQKW